MSLLGLGVFLLLTLPALAVIPNLFVCANGATWVTAINPNTQATQRITVGSHPIRIAMLPPNGATAYVSNHLSDTISVINTQNKTVTATISSGIANGPQELTVSPDGNNLYVVHEGGSAVEKISTSSNSVVGSVTIAQARAADVLVTLNNAWVYVANFDNDTVDIINASTFSSVDTSIAAPGARRLAIAPGGNRVFATDYNGGKVTVIKTSDRTKLADVTVGTHPRGIAIKSDGSEIWVTNVTSPGSVSVIDNSSLMVTHTIGVGNMPWQITLTPDGKAYVSNSNSDSITIIDTGTYTVDKTLTTTDGIGDGPFFSVVDPSGEFLWVSNGDGTTVTEIELATESVANTVTVVDNVGEKPFDLMFSTP